MKVLQCINSLATGGAEVFAVSLTLSLKNIGCDVEFFTYSGTIDQRGVENEKALLDAGIAHRSPRILNNLWKPRIPLEIARAIDAYRPDICHSHLEQSDFFALIGSRLAKHRPLMARTLHSSRAFDRLPPFIHRWMSDAYDANVACGPAAREQHPYLKAGDYTINNGINLAGLTRKIDAESIRATLAIPADTTLLVHVGAFDIRNQVLVKAQDIIVRSFAALRDQNVMIAFLGDGPERESIEGLARSLGVHERCRFPGRVNNPADYLYAADGVLMPSRFEGLSIACIEAVCAGKPVIVSDIMAFAPFKGPATIFVEPASVDALENGIRQLLGEKERYRDLALQQEAVYRDDFNIDAVARRYVDLYEQLLTKGK